MATDACGADQKVGRVDGGTSVVPIAIPAPRVVLFRRGSSDSWIDPNSHRSLMEVLGSGEPSSPDPRHN